MTLLELQMENERMIRVAVLAKTGQLLRKPSHRLACLRQVLNKATRQGSDSNGIWDVPYVDAIHRQPWCVCLRRAGRWCIAFCNTKTTLQAHSTERTRCVKCSIMQWSEDLSRGHCDKLNKCGRITKLTLGQMIPQHGGLPLKAAMMPVF